MSWPPLVERLLNGEQVQLRPKGQSMVPKIKSGQLVTIIPVGRRGVIETGMIVLAKVKGRHYLHLVTAIDGERVQISNNHGHVNGWTTKNRVFGIVSRIEP